MKVNVQNKRERLDALKQVLVTTLGHSTAKVVEMSDVKRDGTVFLRFKSTTEVSAIEATEAFGRHLMGTGAAFMQTDDNRIRMPLP